MIGGDGNNVCKLLMRKFNDIRLRNKLFLSFILVVFIPVFVVGAFLTQELRRTALDNAIAQTHGNVERVKERVTDVLEEAIVVSDRLLIDPQLKQLVNRRYETTLDVVKAYREYDPFERIMEYSDGIANIKFYVENPTHIPNWKLMQTTPEIRQAFWYRAALREKGLIGWYYIPDETKQGKKFLSLVRRIDFPEYKRHGMLVIAVNEEQLNLILQQEQVQTMIVDDRNAIVAANRPGLVGKTWTQLPLPAAVASERNGTFQGEFDNEPSQIVMDELIPATSFNGLRVVSVIANQNIVADANRFGRLGFTVILISVCLASVLIYAVSMLLSARLFRLSEEIQKVAGGDFQTTLKADGKDEIGRLSRTFNHMVKSIQTLMREVEESNRQKSELELRQKDMKLKMLASQINPHFLFNCLESIRMKAHLSGEKEIARVVKLLGKLMRKKLAIGGERIPLHREMEMIRWYLQIQQFRFQDRLTYEVRIDPAVEAVLIPPLIIQPLVENAVIHGLESKEGDGCVRVNAMRRGDELHIEVADDGVGIAEEKRKAIELALNRPEADGDERIGLRNVHQRLQLSYGQAYGIHLQSEPGKGTRIHFVIPIGRERHVQGHDRR